MKAEPLTAGRTALFLYILIWFCINLVFLTSFPAAHTDEPWLSGLTRNMMETGNPDCTEPFFDTYPRHPHAVKILYHALQMPFIKLFGYSLFSVRLLSLLSGAMTLWIFSTLIQRLTGIFSRYSLIFTVLFSLDIQFLSSIHTARQEGILVLVLLLTLLHYLSTRGLAGSCLTGGIIGLSSGFHPNAYILAWALGLIFLADVLRRKRRTGEILLYSLGVASGASVFLLLSLSFNSGFIRVYSAFGSEMGVSRSMGTKIRQFIPFIGKLFFRIEGTYYLPDIRVQMIIFPLIILTSGIKAILKPSRITNDFLIYGGAGTAGILTGLITLGKYSPPSFVFLTPFFYILLAGALHSFKPVRRKTVLLVLTAIISLSAVLNITGEVRRQEKDYNDYLSVIRKMVPGNSRVLGSLYGDYAFENGVLLDFRNLSELPRQEDSLSEYIRSREIGMILLSDEISFIYENRPVWNVLYGNPSYWYPRLMDFINSEAVLEGEIPGSSWSMRIRAFQGRQNWTTKIYRVLPASSTEE